MIKHIINVVVQREYQIVVDDPIGNMTNADAALRGFEMAKANPDALISVDGQRISAGDIECAMYFDTFEWGVE